MNSGVKLLIPKDHEGDWKYIVNACKEISVDYVEYDIYAVDWIDKAMSLKVDGCIYRPEYRHASWRQLFQERIRAIALMLRIPVYPGIHELELYESKRRMAYWLTAHNVPHPQTWIFGDKNSAGAFIDRTRFPLIYKTDFGNCGQGVRIVRNAREALKIVRAAFGNGYTVPSYDPQRLDLWRRFKAVVRPIYRRLRGIRHIPPDREIDSVVFQELIDLKTEWRAIRIGNSYFAHDKLPGKNGLRSGSGLTDWTIPPDRLFEFVKMVCDLGGFNSMALDVFEDKSGNYLVNELQTVFGVVAKNQMYRVIDGKRISLRKYFDAETSQWLEEEGEFGQDYCYRLRVRDFSSMLTKQK